jgi:hypothetical protein
MEISKMREVTIDYEKVKLANVKRDAEKAIQAILSGSEGEVVTLSPPALNPLLKALESLGLWKQVVIIPGSDSNRPSYTVVKISQEQKVVSINTSDMD